MVEIKAPASKSCAQRAVICATLANGVSVVRGVGHSDDLLSAIDACRTLGATIEHQNDDLQIVGAKKLCSGIIKVGESGLLTRLLTPVAAFADGRSEIQGRGTLCRRPMQTLIEALRQLGVTTDSSDGYLPLAIGGKASPQTIIRLDGSDGSQVLSGLLIAPVLAPNETVIEVSNLHSRPYIDLTINVLNQFGIEIKNDQYHTFKIKSAQHFNATHYQVEGDWSSASYFLVADAIVGGGKIRVSGLDHHSTQADRAIADLLTTLEGLQPFYFDATHCPDLFASLVTLASHREGKSRIKGISRLQHKESARDVVLRDEWRKFGVEIILDRADDTMIINGLAKQQIIQSSPINPHGDHRIAMASAMMGRGVMVDSREVVSKSYPEFWADYQQIEHLLNDISV